MNPLSAFYTLRSYVSAYAGLLGPRFLSLIWVAAICAVIWFFGYLIGYGDFKPLQSATNRLIVIGVVITAWLIYMVISLVRARKRDKALVDDLEGNAESDAQATQKAEVAEIRDRLKEALTLLRRVTRKRFGYVYELPWYVIFGAPGSGKTTALTNSGLKFPLGDALGTNAVQGVGGTRNCNWWFTDEAILIDTAGRYTTQDDLNGASKAGWEGFLSLLKKHRRSQPINGAIVTLSVGDLLERDSQACLEEVRAIRQRLSELDEFLQARVPVYLVLTKADLLTGFVEFFDGFNKSDREQVWGMTFDLESSYKAEDLPQHFTREFGLLQERVGAMLIERLQQEPDSAVRGRIFRFPAELSTMKEKLQEILDELCEGSRLVAPPLLRGIYFASGTQTEETARNLPAVASPRVRRSYFLTRLFKDVIFEEASLVARDKRLTRRQVILRRIALGAACVFVLVILSSWLATYLQNVSAIAQAEERINSYEQQIRGIPIRGIEDTDFLRILPALDDLRDMTDGFHENAVWPISFGLDQGEKIESRQRDAYQRALNAWLLPRMLVQLQQTMRNSDDTTRIFDALKLYGMLGGLGPIDIDFAEAGAERMFTQLYPGEGRAAARRALIDHAKALVAGPIASIELNGAIIDEAREQIAEQSMASRAFDILQKLPEARALTQFNPAAELGSLGEQAFVRKSDKSLRDGIPGLFTRDGYHNVVLPHLTQSAHTALNEQWVRGTATTVEGRTVESIAQSALQLYFDEFEQQWSGLLADMRTQPSEDFAEATETTRILSTDPFPLSRIAAAIAENTNLRGPADLEDVETTSTMLTTAEAPDPYAELREILTKSESGEENQGSGERRNSALTNLQQTLDELYGQLSRAATSSAEVASLFDTRNRLMEANQTLLEQARRLPEPLGTWAAGTAADIDSLIVRAARTRLSQLWASDGAKLCSSIVGGRYPFDRRSRRDVAIADFVRLFGPSGLFATFFQDRLKPFVDTSSSPWRWRGTFGMEGAPSGAIAQFENANTIRRAYFPEGAESPNVTINITPESLSQQTNAVLLEVEGERVAYFHGPIQSKTIDWPSNDNSNLSRIAFQPGGWQSLLTQTGDWSLFRLLDEADVTTNGQDILEARFTQGQNEATFEFQFGSVLNPYRMQAIEEFKCPTQF